MSYNSISSTLSAGNDRHPYIESLEKLGLARAVAADEYGKVGEVFG